VVIDYTLVAMWPRELKYRGFCDHKCMILVQLKPSVRAWIMLFMTITYSWQLGDFKQEEN